MIKKLKAVAVEFAVPVLALALPLLASAQIAPAPISAPTLINNFGQVTSRTGIICTLINWFFWLLIVLVIIFVLVAAFRYLSSGGDSEGVSSAGRMLLYAAVAVVVALIAKGLPLIVSTFIGGGLAATGC